MPTVPVNTITPDPTPRSSKTGPTQNQGVQAPSLANAVQIALQGPESPVSPVSDYDNPRPFSFEAVQPQKPAQAAQQQQQQRAPPLPVQSYSPISPLPVTAQFPPRTTSRPEAQPFPQQQPTPAQSFTQQQSTTPEQPSPTVQPRFPLATQTSEDSFTPLTVNPVPGSTPAITNAHLSCYTHHTTFVPHANKFQPTMCMVCRTNNDWRKVACAWCYLRICQGCHRELMRVPGRDLGRLLEMSEDREDGEQRMNGMAVNENEKMGMGPSVVVTGARDEDMDFS